MSNLNRKSEMKYCDVCNTWIKNHVAAIAMHEQGANHKANVAKRLHQQRLDEDKRVKDEAAAKKTLAAAEAEAEAQFKADQQAAAAARAALGTWDEDESGHLYNARLRYYYNKSNGMYYGGDPPAWTTTPAIPEDARYERMQQAAAAAARAAAPSTQPSAAAVAAAQKRKEAMAAHPLANTGGFQTLVAATVGSAAVATTSVAHKKARVAAAAKLAAVRPKTKEDLEFEARREAARKRVASREAAKYGK